MSYFTNFPFTNYVFGNQSASTVFQDLGVYVDLVDIAKDDAAFYTYYDLQNGDRPDQISQKLYNRSDLNWTFSILNDNIKLQGWPLSNTDLTAKLKKDYPNTTITTRTDISTKFKVGSTVTGSVSQTKGKVLRRRLDFGQIIVGQVSEDNQITQTTDVKGYIKLELSDTNLRFTELSDWIITKAGVAVTAPTVVSGGAGYTFIEYNFGKSNANVEYVFNTKVIEKDKTLTFNAGEQITTTEDETTQFAIVDSSVLEYNATHHYEDADGKYVDITPNAPFVQRISVELELDGATDANVNNAVVKSISASTTLDYSANVTLTDIQKNIDKGFYTTTGSVLKATVDAYNDVINTDITKTLDGLTGMGGATDNDFGNNFPAGTSLTELNSELRTELKAAVGVADTNSNSKYTVTVHMFFLIDNQLNVILSNNVFGAVYEYNVSSVKTFKVNYVSGGTATTSTQVHTKQLDAFIDISVDLEAYIQANLSTFNPATLTTITYSDRAIKSNNALKSIKVLKPTIIEQVVKTFNNILIETQDFGNFVGSAPVGQSGTGNTTVTGASQPTTVLAGQTLTSSSAEAISSATSGSSSSSSSSGSSGSSSSSSSSSGGGGYY